MQKKFMIFSIAFFAFLQIFLYAQDNQVPTLEAKPRIEQPTQQSSSKTPLHYHIGLKLGMLSGYGFSGGIDFPYNFTIRATGFLMKAGNTMFYSFGSEFQFHFANPRSHNLYASLGFGYYYSSSNSGNELDNPTRIGAGFGYNYFLHRNWMLDIQLNLTWFTGYNSSVLPLPQIGFYYAF